MIPFDFKAWKANELAFIQSEDPHYTMQELEWDLEHSDFYQDDADNAPYPGRCQQYDTAWQCGNPSTHRTAFGFNVCAHHASAYTEVEPL